MKILPSETIIKGEWITNTQNQVVGDDVCNRVEELIRDYLIKLASDWSGWETLYQDPADHRYWEHTYPKGYMHGGGPPTLRNLSLTEVREKYFGNDKSVLILNHSLTNNFSQPHGKTKS